MVRLSKSVQLSIHVEDYTSRLEVIRDEVAGVYIATSPDIAGLVLEAESVPEIVHEASLVVPQLLNLRHSPTGVRNGE